MKLKSEWKIIITLSLFLLAIGFVLKGVIFTDIQNETIGYIGIGAVNMALAVFAESTI